MDDRPNDEGLALPAVPLEPLRERDPHQLGEFRLLGRLGAGGMGVAFLAQNGRGWAVVKMIRSEIADDRSFRARLTRELDAMRRAAGDRTAQVLASDVDADPPWFAMEFIPGVTLSRRVQDSGPFSALDVYSLAADLAAVLAQIHERGIIHRDFKPSNIMLSPTGPKLIDFGIADVADGTQITRTGSVLGSAGWLSPEQVRGDPATTATDVHAWALAVLFAATGTPPFGADSTTASIYKVLELTPDVPSTIPQPLAGLLRSALDKDPSRRPALRRVLTELSAPPQAIPEGSASNSLPPPQKVATAETLAATARPAPPTRVEPARPPQISRPVPPTMSPLVIIAFLLSMMGFACGIPAVAALVLATIGLRHSPRPRPGRGLAYAALAVASMWCAVFVGLAAASLVGKVGPFYLVPGLMGLAIAAVGFRIAGVVGRRRWISVVILIPSTLFVMIGAFAMGTPYPSTSSAGESTTGEATTSGPTFNPGPSSSAFSVPPTPAASPAFEPRYEVVVEYEADSIPDRRFDNTLTWMVDICSPDRTLLRPTYSSDIRLYTRGIGNADGENRWRRTAAKPEVSAGGRCDEGEVNVVMSMTEPTPTTVPSFTSCKDYRLVIPETPNYRRSTVDMCVRTFARASS